jgi:2-polyprenyl-6-hydroxyphenyl methylase/3-demethylubiquinone-9 3-methyltransferase
MNADQSELEKFSAWGGSWWKPTGEFLLLHRVNPHRLGYIDERAPLKGKAVLDVGCGGGILVEGMSARGARATGIDLADGVLAAARGYSQAIGSGSSYRKIAVEDMARENPGRFDLVTCMEMLEHVPDPAAVVRSIGALVKPGGDVFISTLNRSFVGLVSAIIGLEYVLRLVPVGTHDWRKFITPLEMQGFCREAGLDIVDWQGILYNPLTERFRLGSSTSVNYLLHARRIR